MNANILLDDLRQVATNLSREDFFKKTILISGGTGLIGSLIAKSLLVCNEIYNNEINVICLVRDEKKVKNVFGDIYINQGIQFIYGDIKDIEVINQHIDYIFHTANPTASQYFVSHPVETIDTIFNGTKTMLDIARQHNAKMVYVSSMEVYGTISEVQDHRNMEDELGKIDILDTRSCYSEGKRSAECLCRSYYEEYGVKVIIARLAQTFGPGVEKTDNRIFMQFIRSVLKGEDIILHTDGKSFGNYCYTKDAINALFILLTKGAFGEAYNIANEASTMRIVDMAHIVANDIANRAIGIKYCMTEEIQKLGYAPKTNLMLSTKKIQSLGWNPQVSIQESFSRLMSYIMDV